MRPEERKRIALLDFWSEKNRGDAAMQVALIELVEKYFPGYELVVIAAYGANQWPKFLDEFDYSRSRVAGILGGLRPTFLPFGGSRWLHQRPIRMLADAGGAVAALVLLPFLRLGVLRAIVARLLPKAFRHTLTTLASVELVIWNGRNFRSNGFLREPYDMLTLVYNPMVCLALGKHVAAVGVSIWKLRNPVSRAVLRWVMRRLFFVSAREEESFARLASLTGPKQRVARLPDLSFYVLKGIAQTAQMRPGHSRLEHVGLTLVDWWGDGPVARGRYVRAMQGLVKHLTRDIGARVTVVPQVTYRMERTDALARSIISDADSKLVTVIEKELGIDELVRLYASLDILVATRMHSAIFALVSGTPVLAVAYDQNGKWGILEELGLGHWIVRYTEVDSQTLVRKLNELWKRREDVIGEVRKRVMEACTKVEDNVKLLRLAYDALGRQGG